MQRTPINPWSRRLMEIAPPLRRRTARAPQPPPRVAAVFVPVTLVSLGALHVDWAMGWRWPGGSDRAFAEHSPAPPSCPRYQPP